jgi:type III secretion protein S
MDDIVFAGNKALYLVLILSSPPIAVATIIGLIVGLFQTVTQLQEQTLPFGIKLLGVTLCLYLLAGWFGETLIIYSKEVIKLALKN